MAIAWPSSMSSVMDRVTAKGKKGKTAYRSGEPKAILGFERISNSVQLTLAIRTR